MFVNSTIQNGTIISMKLTSGDEVIAKVVSQGTGIVCVSKPIVLVMTPNGVAFMSFMIGADDNAQLTFNTDQILVMTPAREELKNAYIENTSGIIPASGTIPEGLLIS